MLLFHKVNVHLHLQVRDSKLTSLHLPPPPTLSLAPVQVNSISMLGKTLAEALHVLQGVLDRINLLVCFGYDPTTVSEHHTESCRRQTVDTVDEFGSESLHNHNGSGGEVVV